MPVAYVLLGGGAAAGVPSPAAAQYQSGVNGKIAFDSDRDGNREIYVMDASGSNQTRLTENTAADFWPVWSPAGDRIAFDRYSFDGSTGPSGIYIMDADGSNQTWLTTGGDPAWSPDGTKIAYGGMYGIYTMDADGANQTMLDVPGIVPAWSPDGTRIAYQRVVDGDSEIYLTDPDGSDQTQLTTNSAWDGLASWSPDGSKIAFASDRDGNYELYVMDADGSNQTRLTTNSSYEDHPAWSPDGTKIAFASDRDGSGGAEIYVMDANGSNQTRLTSDPAHDNDPSWQAAPASPCSFDAGSATVSAGLTAAGAATLGRFGDAIVVNGLECGAATVFNTDTIAVTGGDSDQALAIDLSHGGLAPGLTDEGGAGGEYGGSEIEIQVDLGAGSDSLTIIGSSGADSYWAGVNGINLNADGDADVSLSGVESLTLQGNAGNDVLSGAGGGGTGAAYPADIQVYGGNDADTILGGAGSDLLFGGPGNDVFSEQAATNGSDTFTGGAGTDKVSYALRTSAVTVTTADSSANDGAPGEHDFVKSDIENVTGGSGNDSLTGSPAGDALNGGPGADALYGGGGDDTLQGGTGNDQLYGGAANDTFDEGASSSGADTLTGGTGVDTVSYAGRSNAVSVSLGDGLAQDGETAEGDLVRADVENVAGGAGADTLTGGTAANALNGGAGDDDLYGGGGPDVLRGGDGDDDIWGGAGDDAMAGDAGSDELTGGAGNDLLDEGGPFQNGNDRLSGGAGTDTISYAARTSHVYVDPADGLAEDGGTLEDDYVLPDIENITGGSGGDALQGTSLDNVIVCGGGNDSCGGGTGGYDTIYGGDGDDQLGGTLVYGGAGNDSLGAGFSPSFLYGGDGDDTFWSANGFADLLDGGPGNDVVGAWDPALDALANFP